MIQVLSSTPAARLPAMLRSATLAIEVSSTCMKVAIEITTATSHGLRSPAAERLRSSRPTSPASAMLSAP